MNDNNILRAIFLKSLPVNIQQHLAANDSLWLTDLSLLADELIKIQYQTEQRSEIMQDEVNELKSQIRFLKSKLKPEMEQSTCYYHRTYGVNARKCREPCDWKNKQPTGNAKGSQ